MSATIIRNGRIIDPANERDQIADLLVVDEKIADVSQLSTLNSQPEEIDARGLIVAAARFVRRAPDQLDPAALHLALGLAARQAGGTAICEPRMTFEARPDPPDVQRRVPRLLRDAAATWTSVPLHRDPPGPRERLIGRLTDPGRRKLNSRRENVALEADCRASADGLRRRMLPQHDRLSMR